MLLLGREQRSYGEYASYVTEDGHAAATLSVGSDPASPSLAFKGDAVYPNEDAVLLRCEGARDLLAVADAHFGRESSEVLLEALAESGPGIPGSAGELAGLVRSLVVRERECDSGSTLLVAVLDHERGWLDALCFGDSTLWVETAAGRLERVSVANRNYVCAGVPASLDVRRAHSVGCEVGAGALVLLHTDGVDECCYGVPERSIGVEDMQGLLGRCPEVEGFVNGLTELALTGVRGEPGGQDNVAVVGARRRGG